MSHIKFDLTDFSNTRSLYRRLLGLMSSKLGSAPPNILFIVALLTNEGFVALRNLIVFPGALTELFSDWRQKCDHREPLRLMRRLANSAVV